LTVGIEINTGFCELFELLQYIFVTIRSSPTYQCLLERHLFL